MGLCSVVTLFSVRCSVFFMFRLVKVVVVFDYVYEVSSSVFLFGGGYIIWCDGWLVLEWLFLMCLLF